ncbi:hypothetical protein GHT06_014528 [Daphnia sinensis]|uniref:Uncharacterized protein n=1 Tax=Daphnia sinensis TaxID=1820382 RepID=A0AAD5L9F7_9CRUS|nr:hypothetical protein GHT06_014528 [Daphnia sinensis]
MLELILTSLDYLNSSALHRVSSKVCVAELLANISSTVFDSRSRIEIEMIGSEIGTSNEFGSIHRLIDHIELESRDVLL